MLNFKIIIHNFFFFNTIRKIKKQDKTDLSNWIKTGLQLPPPEIVKHNIIMKYAKKERVKTFIGNNDYISLRYMLLKGYFQNIIKYDRINNLNDGLSKAIKATNKSSIIWIDSNAFLQYKTKDKILAEIIKIIKVVTPSNDNHTLLWDNAHLFIKNSSFPNVQELKTFFLQEKPFYATMKTENNVFVMARKL